MTPRLKEPTMIPAAWPIHDVPGVGMQLETPLLGFAVVSLGLDGTSWVAEWDGAVHPTKAAALVQMEAARAAGYQARVVSVQPAKPSR